MDIEKLGKVEIIRLKDKKFKPDRKKCRVGILRRIFKRKKVRSEEIIDSDKILNLIINTFGNDSYHILISDDQFRAITKEQMETLLKSDNSDQFEYTSWSDCDDFSDLLLGRLTEKTWTQGYAIGQLWYYTPEYGHALNVFCTGNKILICEPQNDSIFEWPIDWREKGWRAFMVKF
jgi:hypothetical protein